jgi:predicted nucleic acid-binding protein
VCVDAARVRTHRLESGFVAGCPVTSRSAPLLGENLSHPAHDFWNDSLQLPAAVKDLEARLRGYRQLTDAYLLALAHRRKGVLATFDRGLRTIAGDSFEGALEIVPTR